MKRSLMIACFVLSLFFLGTNAGAQDFGIVCFDTNFDDRLFVWAVNEPRGSILMMALPARWEGPTAYLLNGIGHLTSSFPAEGTLTMSLMLDNNSGPDFWNGNQACILHAELNPDPPYFGTWTINCRGENPTFPVSGTMVKIPCDDVESFGARAQVHPHSMKGHLAGESNDK